jgi:hypothetical protein
MKVYHWWPGRTWAGPCPIPPVFVAEAERLGTLYVTFAVHDDGVMPICGVARCCPKDVPSRKLGRAIAIGRLRSTAHALNISIDDAVSV